MADVQRLNSIKNKAIAALDAADPASLSDWHTIPFIQWLRTTIGIPDMDFLSGYMSEVGAVGVDTFIINVLKRNAKYANL